VKKVNSINIFRISVTGGTGYEMEGGQETVKGITGSSARGSGTDLVTI